MEPVFGPSSQQGGVDGKIVASLERLAQVFRVLLREEAQKHDLSPIQAQFLVYLFFRDVDLRRVSRLAEEFDLTRATVSDAVSSLGKKALIQRESWPEDKRVVTLRLTPAGRSWRPSSLPGRTSSKNIFELHHLRRRRS
ncbi:MAG TPA: MarR family winged helix-turn-helix transcriptional regulator [Rubrobacteraceae bacterium]|nr:MarR family winged helix-turn-helix transcriptional regulator [Rubrobacteraceae bacterium]